MSELVVDPAAKFQLLTQVPLPGYCSACRKESDGRLEFVDLTLDLDYYGAVVICRPCAEEIARMLGYKNDADLDAIIVARSDAEEALLAAEEKVKVLENVVFTYGIDRAAPTDEPAVDEVVDISEESGKQKAEPAESGSFK